VGAAGSARRCVQRHGGADERLEGFLIDLVALAGVDGTPRVAFEDWPWPIRAKPVLRVRLPR
jgi:hypothetical protein